MRLKGRRERAAAILRELTEHGVDGLAEIHASPTASIDGRGRRGTLNAAVLLPPTSSSTLILNLGKDLRELAAGGGRLGTLTGAASVVFGGASPGNASESVNPTPTVDHSSVQQDRAVHSAMTNPLTVVTGPPRFRQVAGGPKHRGRRCLSGENRPDRFEETTRPLMSWWSDCAPPSPLCPVVRAGAASQRQALASDIDRMVGEAERAEPAQGLVDASDQWHQVHRQVQAVHDAREERQLVLQEMQSLESRLAGAPLPAGVPAGLTEDAVVNATAKVKAAFSGTLQLSPVPNATRA